MRNLFAAIITILTIQTSLAGPAKMDPSTQDALISKLESLLPNLTEDKAQQTTVRIRIADLYSDRAREKDLLINESCEKCESGEADRKKAISYYERVRDHVNVEQFKHVSMQLAHLYKLTNQIDKSDRAFKNILKDSRLSSAHQRARLGVADITYGKGHYKKAIGEFKQSLPATHVEDQIYIHYRLAWCYLYSEDNAQSVKYIQTAIKIAQSHDNEGWQTDLMEDYATLLSHSQFSKADVETYISYSKPEERAKNIKFLGQEAERLGNKRAALLIWTQYILAEKSKNDDKAEIQLKLAQNFFDLNQYAQSLFHLDQTVQAVNKDKCEDCAKVTADFRSFIVTWNKKEKTDPSPELTIAYEKFLSIAENDFEATVWAAQVAIEQKQYTKATAFYEKAARIAKPDQLESMTSSMIEAAEESKDKKLLETSLHQYLSLNSNGKRKYEVMYQIAFINFQNKKFEDAYSQFKRLALESNWSDKKLRYQAANISIDALTELKRDSDIRDTADSYTKAFPEHFAHFAEISRRVTTNLVVSGNQSEIKRLMSYRIDYLKPQEQIRHHKTIILAAEKAKDFEIVESTSKKLLNTAKASTSDVHFANKSLLWTFEQRQDYINAYKTALVTPMSDLSADRRHLKLGLLAELAHQSPTKHFEAYLKTTKSVRGGNEIRIKMIRANPKLYDQMRSKLIKTPDLFAAITLELHLQKPNFSRLNSALKVGGVKSSSHGRYMHALIARENFDHTAAQVRNHKINQRNLRKSIQQRISLLSGLEKNYKQALRVGDLTLQLKTLRVIAVENRKFYNQINAMMPRGLKKKEREVYQSMLAQQSKPFLVTAEQAEKNIKEFSDVNEKALNELENAIESENMLERQIALHEFTSLKPYANGTLLAYLDEQIAQLRARARR